MTTSTMTKVQITTDRGSRTRHLTPQELQTMTRDLTIAGFSFQETLQDETVHVVAFKVGAEEEYEWDEPRD